jgi:hypothetical protein
MFAHCAQTMKNCLMYKMSYYRFHESPYGATDRVRGQEVRNAANIRFDV